MGYLTVAEFTGAPTGASVDDLSYGGSTAVQTAELVRVIARASKWMDNTANCTLGAHRGTRNQRVRLGRYGEMRLHPREVFPVALTALSYGLSNLNLTVSTFAGSYVDEQDFVVPLFTGPFGPQIQLWSPVRGAPFLATYSYTAGWPNTTLTAPATVGAISLTVGSTLCMTVGQDLTIADLDKTETVIVTGITSTTVVATSATTQGHSGNAGVAVHAMPEDLKEAAILATAGFIKARGNDAMVMSNLLSPGATQGDDPTSSADLRLARSILANYAVIR